ncbi:sensor domain-containing phosphodiesterase [Parafrankia elaeagni]|uniref:sensor domain-containing phosphodiesterase n=1 Tax=Parafrankia elaeagni TaxID=222534 RepID=UPI000684F90C|nr:EAL domain-containing protein [Parafrankia elaeagni]
MACAALPLGPPRSLGPESEAIEADPSVTELLGVLRRHLGMELAFLGSLDEQWLVLQVLDGDAASFGVRAGSTIRREAAVHPQVLGQDEPVIIPDAHRDERLGRTGMVDTLGVGSYAAALVFDNDADVYGLVGCLGHEPHPRLRPRDGRFVGLLAAFLSDAVIDLRRAWESRSRASRVVSDLIDAGGPDIVFQPVVDLRDGTVAGVEALSRFPGSTGDPEGWYTVAGQVGLGTELELAAIRRALAAVRDLPPPVALSLNAAPATIASGLLGLLGTSRTCHRIIVEITEHEHFSTDPAVARGIAALRALGARIAVDDMGTGYAGLEQLIRIRPEIVKLDYVITHGVDVDPARQAVAAAIVSVARKIGCQVIAEGIETAAELRAVRGIGIDYGQGFLLGRPAGSVRAACSPAAVSLRTACLRAGPSSG